MDQLAKTSDEDLNSVQLVAYHFWQTTRRYLTGFDRSTGVLAFVAPTRHSYAGLKAGARYYLENALAFLDAPGEWYLSRTGKLYYRPRPGEDLAKATVVAPRLSTLFAFKGAAGHFIEYLSFQGLSFRYSQWITPPDGVFPDQSAFSIHAAVMADGVRHVSLENCEISHTGKYALWFRNGCSNVIVRHCLFQDLGGGGIRVGGMTLPADGAQRTSNVEVDNNIICHGGRIFPSAVGIWIGTSSDNKITHNDVSDFYSTGISIGWQWGYAASSASGNRIDFNHIHHLGWGLLSDLGGIYTLGMSPGTECNGNVIHDIRAGDYGGWGIYFDEGSSQILAENNLVYATTHGGFHQHYGRENLVRNNIFALNRDAQLQLTLSEPHLSLTFEHNIIYWQKGELFAYEWGRADIQSDYNLFFQASTSESRFDNKSLLASEPQGRDLHSQVADPGFRKPASGDFTLPVNSPAFQVGFKPFDYQQAGVYGTEEWRRLAETLSGRLCPIGWSTIHSPPGEGFVSMRERCPLNTRSSAERGSATRF
ncbi:MAG: right-handed parallel beta-helix repeat-containing protein [Lacunisphaera sp.]